MADLKAAGTKAGNEAVILNEEKAANESLTALARERSNDEALGESRDGHLEVAGAKR